jgi:hypothetical protein
VTGSPDLGIVGALLLAQWSDVKIRGLARYSQRYQCGGTLLKAVLQSINVGEAEALIISGPRSSPRERGPDLIPDAPHTQRSGPTFLH